MIGTRARWFAGATALAAAVAAMLLFRGGDRRSPSPSAATAARFEASSPVPAAPASVAPKAPVAPGGPSAASAAQSLTTLAENSEDPRVLVATLEALGSTYAARGTRKPRPDAELERVLVKHLASTNDAVSRAALTAARVSLLGAEPQAGVVEAVVALTHSNEALPRRAAALEALNFLRPDRRSPSVLSALAAALGAEPPELVSLALLALSRSGTSLEAAPEATRAELAGHVLRLLDHGNPGVRGRALLVLAEIPSLAPDDRRYEAGTRALLDRDAYVNAQAADLLARCGRPAAIHRLVEGVLDFRAARYELRAAPGIGGASGVLVHEVPGRRSVAEAVVFAMKRLGEAHAGLEPLVVSLRDRHSDDALVARNAAEASAWYLRNRRKIPRERE